MSIKEFFFVSIFFVAVPTNAQVFLKKDSVRSVPCFNLGFGVYLGAFIFTPKSSNANFNNQPGVNTGWFVKVGANIVKKLALNASYGRQYATSFIKYNSNNYSNTLNLSAKGYQLGLSVQYTFYSKKNSEILGISAGLTKQDLVFTTHEFSRGGNLNQVLVIGAVDYFYNANLKANTFNVELNKKTPIGKKLNLGVYMQFAQLINNYSVRNVLQERYTFQTTEDTIKLGFSTLTIGVYIKN